MHYSYTSMASIGIIGPFITSTNDTQSAENVTMLYLLNKIKIQFKFQWANVHKKIKINQKPITPCKKGPKTSKQKINKQTNHWGSSSSENQEGPRFAQSVQRLSVSSIHGCPCAIPIQVLPSLGGEWKPSAGITSAQLLKLPPQSYINLRDTSAPILHQSQGNFRSNSASVSGKLNACL